MGRRWSEEEEEAGVEEMRQGERERSNWKEGEKEKGEDEGGGRQRWNETHWREEKEGGARWDSEVEGNGGRRKRGKRQSKGGGRTR